MGVGFAVFTFLNRILQLHSLLIQYVVFFAAVLLVSLSLRSARRGDGDRTEYVVQGSHEVTGERFLLREHPGFKEIVRDGDFVSYMDNNGILIRTKIASGSAANGAGYAFPLIFAECVILTGIAMLCLHVFRSAYLELAMQSAGQGAAREAQRLMFAVHRLPSRLPRLLSSFPLVTLRQGLQSFVLKEWASGLLETVTDFGDFAQTRWDALQSGETLSAIRTMTVTQVAKYAGVACAGCSIVLQFFLRFRFQMPEDRKASSRLCKQSAIAAFLFWLAAWAVTINEGGDCDIGMIMVQYAFLCVLMWIFWILSTIGYYGSSNEMSVFSSMRGFCIRFGVFSFLTGCVLRL